MSAVISFHQVTKAEVKPLRQLPGGSWALSIDLKCDGHYSEVTLFADNPEVFAALAKPTEATP